VVPNYYCAKIPWCQNTAVPKYCGAKIPSRPAFFITP
jgi:hypothetical protein